MTARPVPQLDAENEFFWKSGSDGRLRFRRCVECERLHHPPAPICPYCHSTNVTNAAVSGRGVVAALTINEHQWSPAFPPPYAIAIVAIEEDPGIRLTTNVVGCEPSAVRIGMPVHVMFEQHEDVWLPLFTPTGARSTLALPPEERVAPFVRQAPRLDKFEARVALTGVGMSEVGRRLMRPPIALTVEACLRAIDDAGLQLDDIDGLSTYPGAAFNQGLSEGGIVPLAEALRIRPTWINGTSETPGQTGSVVAAMLAVAAGLCRHVLCFRTVWEATFAARQRDTRPAPDAERELRPPRPAPSRVGGDMQWRAPFGASSAANWIAMCATQHFARHGTTRETLATIALNARNHAALNPVAIYREPLTLDDYLGARMISTPFGLYDCDVPCDGAVAIVVSAADGAADLRHRPVLVEAVGTAITERVSWDQGTLEHEPLVNGPAAHLWTRTDLRPSDVDVAELYDGFTFNCLSWLEALGFCETGEAKDYLADPSRIGIGGELPLNTNGGQLSGGRLHGYGLLHEAIVQLRGHGAARQVDDAQVAVVSTGGGAPGGCLLLTTGR